MVTPKKDIVKTPPTKKPKAKKPGPKPKAKPAKKKRTAGQPTKYDPKLNPFVEKICAQFGADDKQLSELLEVSKATISNWKNNYPEFLESLKRGKATFDDRAVVNSLLRRAMGYEYDEVIKEPAYIVKKGKKVILSDEPVVTKVTTKTVIPSTTAIIFWLKNRQPEKWRDRREDPGDTDKTNWGEVMAEFGKAIEGKYVEEL